MQDGAGYPAQVDDSTNIAEHNDKNVPPVQQPAIPSSQFSATTPRIFSAHSWLDGIRRPRTSPGPRSRLWKTRTYLTDDDARRDSGLVPSPSITSVDNRSLSESRHTGREIYRVPSLPEIVVQDESSRRPVKARRTSGRSSTSREPPLEGASRHDPIEPLCRVTTPIPTGNFEDLNSPDKLEFSNRGSMLLHGERASSALSGNFARDDTVIEAPSITETYVTAPSGRVLSADEMMLSQSVRSMYERGDEKAGDWDSQHRPLSDATSEGANLEDEDRPGSPTNAPALTIAKTRQHEGDNLRAPSTANHPKESRSRRDIHEVAGGIEDWEDVEGGDVDRYGFLLPKRISSRGSSNPSTIPEAPQLQRVSTTLKLVSEAPRRKHTLRKFPSMTRSTRSAVANGTVQQSPSKRSLRPSGSLYSFRSGASHSASRNPLRYAANRLPHNRERRWIDEASDMLTLPPGLADVAEEEEGGKAALMMKRKEWSREEKWRRMGRIRSTAEKGAGMVFEFDTKDPKLISRTWKGIPDRWRASAWHAFLTASAKRRKDNVSDEELVQAFHQLQEENSADDVQIDMDVPRTINHHIMFRRRYRGGQRLLFRVLHAISLYLPNTGYVQGMAALAATLLCYYDEENAFVMLVRLWQLRGLDRLYAPGFDGLMEALSEFEQDWLAGRDVAKKLAELGITSTAYGTRWYLTLFNYSIPFPAQLRVWDVFMLLGDASNSSSSATTKASFGADLDVLHATSAALIDATREILLDSDFENAMKTLTSWIPVRDEDLLMRVAKAEWKQRKRRATGGDGR